MDKRFHTAEAPTAQTLAQNTGISTTPRFDDVERTLAAVRPVAATNRRELKRHQLTRTDEEAQMRHGVALIKLAGEGLEAFNQMKLSTARTIRDAAGIEAEYTNHRYNTVKLEQLLDDAARQRETDAQTFSELLSASKNDAQTQLLESRARVVDAARELDMKRIRAGLPAYEVERMRLEEEGKIEELTWQRNALRAEASTKATLAELHAADLVREREREHERRAHVEAIEKIRRQGEMESETYAFETDRLEREVERIKGKRASSTLKATPGKLDADKLNEFASSVADDVSSGIFEPDVPERYFHPAAAAVFYRELAAGNSPHHAMKVVHESVLRALKLDIRGERPVTRDVANADYDRALAAKNAHEKRSTVGSVGDIIDKINGGRFGDDPLEA